MTDMTPETQETRAQTDFQLKEHPVHGEAMQKLLKSGRAQTKREARMILAARKLTEKLKRLSMQDPLTGAYNRLGFLNVGREISEMADRDKRGLHLVFADVDKMKSINDKHGHAGGDRALIDTTRLLQETAREADIVFRIGGDEFVVLAPETREKKESDQDGKDSFEESFKRRLEKKLEEYNTKGEQPFTLSITIGYDSRSPGEKRSLAQILDQADKEMYKRKTPTQDAGQSNS